MTSTICLVLNQNSQLRTPYIECDNPLVPEYLDECRALGIYDVRIIHGKGIGALRETVHSILKKYPHIIEYHLASANSGGWGATSVQLTEKN